jgi:hypothetical protein
MWGQEPVDYGGGPSDWLGPAEATEQYDQRALQSGRSGITSYFLGDGPDRAFIAHAREDVPRLIAEVRRLRALLRQQAE